jgi:hypothetical protein
VVVKRLQFVEGRVGEYENLWRGASVEVMCHLAQYQRLLVHPDGPCQGPLHLRCGCCCCQILRQTNAIGVGNHGRFLDPWEALGSDEEA